MVSIKMKSQIESLNTVRADTYWSFTSGEKEKGQKEMFCGLVVF